jgi:hypothetical protein
MTTYHRIDQPSGYRFLFNDFESADESQARDRIQRIFGRFYGKRLASAVFKHVTHTGHWNKNGYQARACWRSFIPLQPEMEDG